jgi:cysteine desulfurase
MSDRPNAASGFSRSARAQPDEVYADHASTTPALPEVVEAMQPSLGAGFGNASSVHRRGERARDAIDDARGAVAGLLSARPEDIVWTASGSEANNLAIFGTLEWPASGRGTLVVSAIEHPSVLEAARHAESRGTRVVVVPVDRRGIIDLDRLAESLDERVALVSVMAVNNEVGTIQPVAEAARLAHQVGARFHCDAVQAVGKLPVRVEDLDVDLLSFAGHKFGGPPGAGGLFVRRRVRLVPRIHGGHQERGRRAGTENLPAIVGLGVAARVAAARPTHAAVETLGRRLARGLLERVPGCRLNGDPEHRIASIVNVCFSGVDGEAVLQELDREGITVSTGSACSAAAQGPSHVLLAMGLSAEDAHASVRFSLGAGNREADVDRILSVAPVVVERLRALHEPVVKKGA